MTLATRRIGPLYVRAITRKNNSRNGNPSFLLHTSEGDYRMQDDASLGYGIENLTNSRFPDQYVIGGDVPPVTLLATQSGRVWGIEKDGKVLT